MIINITAFLISLQYRRKCWQALKFTQMLMIMQLRLYLCQSVVCQFPKNIIHRTHDISLWVITGFFFTVTSGLWDGYSSYDDCFIIGLSEQAGAWVWETGNSLTYNKWESSTNQPDNASLDDVGGICPDGLHDFGISDVVSFICEIW